MLLSLNLLSWHVKRRRSFENSPGGGDRIHLWALVAQSGPHPAAVRLLEDRTGRA